MIQYIKGNLLDDQAEAVVNTVNEVGVMGKGIALMFKERYPASADEYERACEVGEVAVGRMFVTKNHSLYNPRWIIHFPTKKHWRHPSKLQWVRDGLRDLVRVVRENKIRSVALPPLGCGNGGLEWAHVSREIETAFSDIPDVDVRAYVPISEYLNPPKREGVKKLTPARGLIVGLVRRYTVMGVECTNLEVQKLAWFLSRVIQLYDLPDPLQLGFKPEKYGPYAEKLRHLLNNLDGSYLHCEKRLADAGPMDLIWHEPDETDVVEDYLQDVDAATYYLSFEKTAAVIDGFQSPFGMELLATVDWLIKDGGCVPTVEAVRRGLAEWPASAAAARRKLRLFDEALVGIAIEQLRSNSLIASTAK